MSDWKDDLKDFFTQRDTKQAEEATQIDQTRNEVETFIATVVRPAFDEIKPELERYGRTVTISSGKEDATISVYHEQVRELSYTIRVRIFPAHAHPYSEMQFRDRSDGKTYRAEGHLRSGAQNYGISEISKEEIIRDFLYSYKQQVSRP